MTTPEQDEASWELVDLPPPSGAASRQNNTGRASLLCMGCLSAGWAWLRTGSRWFLAQAAVSLLANVLLLFVAVSPATSLAMKTRLALFAVQWYFGCHSPQACVGISWLLLAAASGRL